MEPDSGKQWPVNPPIRDIEEVAASMECTGLIPAAPESDDEAENYARLYGIHRSKPSRRSRKS